MENNYEAQIRSEEKVASRNVTMELLIVGSLLAVAIAGVCFSFDWLAHYVMDAIAYVRQ